MDGVANARESSRDYKHLCRFGAGRGDPPQLADSGLVRSAEARLDQTCQRHTETGGGAGRFAQQALDVARDDINLDIHRGTSGKPA